MYAEVTVTPESGHWHHTCRPVQDQGIGRLQHRLVRTESDLAERSREFFRRGTTRLLRLPVCAAMRQHRECAEELQSQGGQQAQNHRLQIDRMREQLQGENIAVPGHAENEMPRLQLAQVPRFRQAFGRGGQSRIDRWIGDHPQSVSDTSYIALVIYRALEAAVADGVVSLSSSNRTAFDDMAALIASSPPTRAATALSMAACPHPATRSSKT